MLNKKKILFIGTHGQKNWGDELLLKVFIDQLDDVADEFYVNSYLPEHTKKYINKPHVHVFSTDKGRHKLIYYLIKCDAVVFGGGSIIKELYTAYGGKKYGTLQIIDIITLTAKLLGKPVYFSNIGIGPIDTDKGINMARNILNRVSFTSVRDTESMDYLRRIKPISDFELASDAVLSINKEYLGFKAVQRPHKRLGINLCRNIENNENWDYFLNQLANDLSKYLAYNPDVTLVGIPMQFDVAGNNDESALLELENLLQRIDKRIPIEISKPESVQELAKVIDSVDILVAERLHALILAVIIGKPIVALEYDIKVTGLIDSIGLGEYGVNINLRFKEASIFKLLCEINDNNHKVRSDILRSYKRSNEQSRSSFSKLKKKILNDAK